MELAQPPAASRGSGLGPDSAGFQSLASRVFLDCGNLPAVTYARVLLSNFLLRHGLPGCHGSQAAPGLLVLLPCGGGSAPFPPGQLPWLHNQVLPYGPRPGRAHSADLCQPPCPVAHSSCPG